jgi:hypothetical protein
MDKEHDSFWDKNVFRLTIRTTQNTIGSKTTFKVKRDSEGNVIKHKVRVCARGDKQKEGIDYHETYAPVVKMSTLRILIALATQHGYEMAVSDVNSAYLNAPNNTPTFMELPEGMILHTNTLKDEHFEQDKRHEIIKLIQTHGKPRAYQAFEVTPQLRKHVIIELRQALYGMRQAGREWNQHLNEAIVSKLNFTRSDADPCLYHKQTDKQNIWLGIFVDDILQVAHHKSDIEAFQREIEQHFDMTHNDDTWILGIKIERDRTENTTIMSQEHYINDMLTRFSMQDMKPVSTPDTVGEHLEQTCETDAKLDSNGKFLFQQIVGGLLYLSICTRPDIANSVRAVATHSAEPTQKHLTAAKRIMRYIKGTKTETIKFTKTDNNIVIGFVDASWAEDRSNRRSTTGYIFKLAQGPISWRSKQQNSVTLSTCEAEYMALAHAVQEAIHILQLINSAKLEVQQHKIYLLEDNNSAIFLANNPSTTARTKHINIKVHFVREVIKRGQIVLRHCPTDKMIADILTKALPRIKFKDLATQVLGIKAHEYVFIPDCNIAGGVSSPMDANNNVAL